MNILRYFAGTVSFGWERPLTVNGETVSLKGDYRYDNPYCQAPFGSDTIIIRYNGMTYDITKKMTCMPPTGQCLTNSRCHPEPDSGWQLLYLQPIKTSRQKNIHIFIVLCIA